MEKRVVVAAALSAVLMLWYAQLMSNYQRVYQRAHPSPVASVPAGQPSTEVIIKPIADEQVTFIKSSTLVLEIGQRSGSIRRAILRQFNDLKTGQPLQFGRGSFPVLAIGDGRSDLNWQLASTDERTVNLDSESPTSRLHLKISANDNIPLVELVIRTIPHDAIHAQYSEALTLESSWHKGDELGDRYNPLEVVLLTEKTKPWEQTYVHSLGFRKNEKIVPRGTRILTLSDRYFCQSLKPVNIIGKAVILPSLEGQIRTSMVVSPPKGSGESELVLQLYLGPRDYFQLRNAGMSEAFPIGAIGRIGIMLLTILSWIASMTKNYGIAIIIFSISITCMLAPFTLMGMKSMKKMQELKPQIDRLMAKHKGDPQKANLELMALYKENKVSPLGGCLPMMLQLPVLMAMFRAISHFIDLRGKPFLWIKDLSLPDRVTQLPVALPLVGHDLNLLPILMTITMLVQMKLSQQKMATVDTNPATKMFSGPMMSILFGVMFYQFPSGLVLYWLTNSLMTILWYRVASA